ncbi:Plasmid replication protein RepL domain-containing protein [Vibrio crassostreae]|nr:Plasmid replication protein RepL domain-containing protein [Vibrio crassostreae]
MGKRHLDEGTGELIEEPAFVKLYINDLCKVKGVTGLQANIFHFMLKQMNDHNEVAYGSAAKERFCKSQGTTVSAFNNNIKKLIEHKLIERISRGEFRVNKKYAVKVDWSRVQSIVWTTTYSEGGKKESVSIEESKD